MRRIRCNACGGEEYEVRRTEYLYSHGGQYLLVPDTPVEVCSECGMVYYDASVIKDIEDHFFAIQQETERPDKLLTVPEKSLG